MKPQIPSPYNSQNLVFLGRSVNNEPWLGRFLYQLDLHLGQTEFVRDDEDFQRLRNAFSRSLGALRDEGILSEEVFLALQRASESAPEDLLTAQAAWCWGLSLGKRASYVTSSQHLRHLLEEASRDVVRQEAFLSVTAQSLRERQPKLTAAIEESLARLSEHPEEFVLGRKGDGFIEALATWKELPRYEAFDLQKLEYTPLYYEFLGIVQHLRTIEREDYLFWLNRLENPVVVQQALLDSEITGNFEEFIGLLQAAPAAYSGVSAGRWVSLIAPMLLEVAIHHASEILSPFARLPRDENAYQKACNEISTQMALLAQRLAERIDGPQLAAHWLMRLVRMKTILHPWNALPSSIAIHAIVQVFGDSELHAGPVLAHLPQVAELTEDEKRRVLPFGKGLPWNGRAPKTDVLMCRLLLKAYRPDCGSFVEELQLFQTLLLQRDVGLFESKDTELPTWRHELSGCILLGAHFAHTWKRLWEQLAIQRMRVQHIASTQDDSADEASFFLCAVGLGFLKSRATSTDPEYAPCLALWKEVYGAVWFQSLLYTSHPKATNWRYLLVLLIGVLQKHTSLPSEEALRQLSEVLHSFGRDEELILHTIDYLASIGVGGRLLNEAITRAGIPKEAILKQFERNGENIHLYPLCKRWKGVTERCRSVWAEDPYQPRPT